MIIAVNARFLIKDKLEGIGRFSHETLKRLVLNNPQIQFHFFFDRKFDPSFIYANNIIPHVIFPPARHPFLWYIWFEWSIYFKLKKIKPDYFLSPDGYLCLKSKTKQIPVIHDLAFEHYPKDIPNLVAKYYRYFFPKFAQKATHIFTVSEFSKKDINQTYNINPEKISVVGNAYPAREIKADYSLLNQIVNNQPYFFYLGAIHPRKNILRLIKAFELFKKDNPNNYKLILAGRMAWLSDALNKYVQNSDFSADIIFTGKISDEQATAFYRNARALTYIPYFEGFGLPILEAYNQNCPVISSISSSMPEVAGNAALLVNPTDVESIALAMKDIAFDDQLRMDLINEIPAQLAKYSWEKTVQKMEEVLFNGLPQ